MGFLMEFRPTESAILNKEKSVTTFLIVLF